MSRKANNKHQTGVPAGLIQQKLRLRARVASTCFGRYPGWQAKLVHRCGGSTLMCFPFNCRRNYAGGHQNPDIINPTAC